MKVSTEIGSYAKFIGERKALELTAKAGFDAWDFSMLDMAIFDYPSNMLIRSDHPLAQDNYLSFVRELRKIGEDNGIHCNQSHAPYPSKSPDVQAYFERSLECTAEVGGSICVIHPSNDWTTEQNAEMYNKFLPYAKACKVKIATENMWNWDTEIGQASPASCSDPKSYLELLNAVNDDYFVGCLDIGHAEMRGLNTNSVEMIYALKDKLQALHIHDNDKHNDNHQIPYSMNIEFSPIVKALKDINYNGYFTLEACSFINDDKEILQKLKVLHASIRVMTDEFESL